MAFTTKSDNKAPFSEINITPLVDVMLVLLIIFMVTATVGFQGLNVKLPQAKAQAISITDQMIVVSVKNDNAIFINKDQVSLENLAKRLQTIYATRNDKAIYVRSDADISYGYFVKVISAIKESGVAQLGIVTTPERGR